MRVILDVFRDPDGRLEGSVQLPDGAGDAFASTLDLLRVLEGLDLTRPESPRPACPRSKAVGEHSPRPPEESHG